MDSSTSEDGRDRTTKSITGSVVSGFVWLNGISLISSVLAFVQVILVAHVLDPAAVGLVAVFFIIQGAFEAFTVTGFAKAFIQRRDSGQEYVDTAFVTSFLRGVLLAACVFFAAPYLVSLLDAPKALYVVQAMASVFVLQGARNPGALFFMRRLNFFRQFVWLASGAVVRFATTVALLFILKNEWAIAIGVIAHELVLLVLSFLLIGVKPGLRWDKDVFLSLSNYGKWVLLAAMVAFIERQGNPIVTVRLLGEASLGILYLGLRICQVPMQVTQQLKNVLFPVFSRLQDSLEESQWLFRRSLSFAAFFVFPLAGCMVAFAEPFTDLFLQDAWAPVAGILGLLICAGALQAIASIALSLFNAKGLPKFAFYHHLLQSLTILIAIFPLAWAFGLRGVALLYLLNGVVAFLFTTWILYRFSGFGFRPFSALVFPLFGSGAATIFSCLLQLRLPVDSIILLATHVLLFFALYFLGSLCVPEARENLLAISLFVRRRLKGSVSSDTPSSNSGDVNRMDIKDG